MCGLKVNKFEQVCNGHMSEQTDRYERKSYLPANPLAGGKERIQPSFRKYPCVVLKGFRSCIMLHKKGRSHGEIAIAIFYRN